MRRRAAAVAVAVAVGGPAVARHARPAADDPVVAAVVPLDPYPSTDDAVLVRAAERAATRGEHRRVLRRLALERAAHLRRLAQLAAARARAARLAATAAADAHAAVPAVWQRVARCEADGHWAEVTGNGFLWGLQFTAGTWDAYRGGLPTAASYLSAGAAPSPAEQVAVGRRVLADQGVGAWPVCGPYAGLERGD